MIKTMKNIFSKQSAVARLMVANIVGRPQREARSYETYAKEGYLENVIAYSCISRIARAAAHMEINLFVGDESNRKKIDKHPLIDLLYKPNPMTSDDKFFMQLYSTYLIAGEVFIERVLVNNGTKVQELYIHRPDKMKVVPGESGLPAYYQYDNGMGQKKNFEVNPITGESDILHIKTFHPLNHWRGMSTLSPAGYSIDQHNEGGAWNFGLLKNGARPSGAFFVSDDGKSAPLTPQQFERIKGELKTMTGGENAGTVMLLEGGLDWKEFSLNPKDMDFANTINSSARNIALAFGVPPILLGIPGDSTYNNLSEAKLAFWEDTVLPMVCEFLAELNRWLVPLYGADLYLEEDESEVSALAPRRKEKRDSLKEADWLTINEKRVADGKDKVEGGDVVLVDAGKIPLDMAGVSISQSLDSTQMTQDQYAKALVLQGVGLKTAETMARLVYDARA